MRGQFISTIGMVAITICFGTVSCGDDKLAALGAVGSGVHTKFSISSIIVAGIIDAHHTDHALSTPRPCEIFDVTFRSCHRRCNVCAAEGRHHLAER